MALVQGLSVLYEVFLQQAKEAFQASGGDLEAYNKLLFEILKKFESFNSLLEQNTKEVSILSAHILVICSNCSLVRMNVVL